jgi:Tyrosine phosphatase family
MTTLQWPNLQNARDLGGLPTGDGGHIRSMALIRTDDSNNLENITTLNISDPITIIHQPTNGIRNIDF